MPKGKGKGNGGKNKNAKSPAKKQSPKKTEVPPELRMYYTQRQLPVVSETLGLRNLQSYFPAQESLFPSLVTQTSGNPTLGSAELVTHLTSDCLATVEDKDTHHKREIPVWIRRVHLVDPVDVMEGITVLPSDGALPTFRQAWQSTLRKINDPLNEAYTDAVCSAMMSRLVETNRSPHFCRFFGTFNARVPEYTYNITEDMQDIEHERWFKEGLKDKRYRVYAVNPDDPSITSDLHTMLCNTRPLLEVASDVDLRSGVVDAEEILEHELPSSENIQELATEMEGMEEMEEIESLDAVEEETALVHRDTVRIVTGGESDHSTSEYSEEDDDEDVEYRVVLQNFPVQITVIERCDGTMDSLMDEESRSPSSDKEERWTAWIFQVIAALSVAQQYYEFVHNDLHTNNVVWTATTEPYLYYLVADRYYKVPTFGKIMKIIDFGRATFRPPGASTVWIPDAYAPESDAGDQYNCEPYYDSGRPRVTPNSSFDLCRLAVAMLDSLWPSTDDSGSGSGSESGSESGSGSDSGSENKKRTLITPKRILTQEPGRTQYETTSPLWNLLWLWMTDKNGKNVLRTPTDRERYPGFDLYCAIAKDIQNAIPSQQLTLPLFDNAFKVERASIPSTAQLWRLQK